MNRFLSFLFVITSHVTLAANITDTTQNFPANPIKKPGWILTKHDEFTDTVLNTNLWIPYYFRQRAALDNDVKAQYTFKEGCIILQLFKSGTSSLQTFEHTNLLMTKIKNIDKKVNFSQQYGYFEIRAKTQAGAGHNSAFWLIGLQKDTTQTGEIDVFEQPGKFGNNFFISSFHPWKDPGTKKYLLKGKDFQIKYSSDRDLSATFNIYAVEWTPTLLKYYFNNRLIYVVPYSPRYKMGVLLSLYQSSGENWMGSLDKTISYPKTFVIDYFRAYKKR